MAHSVFSNVLSMERIVGCSPSSDNSPMCTMRGRTSAIVGGMVPDVTCEMSGEFGFNLARIASASVLR